MTGCEWNPEAKRGLHVDERAHAFATVSVGRNYANWHLCAACAALPEFKRYRVRKSLKGQP